MHFHLQSTENAKDFFSSFLNMKYNLAQLDPDSDVFSAYPESVRDGLKFLKQADFSALSNGITKIETDDAGDRLYINVLEYESHSPREAVIEKHEKYVDIHCVVIGREYMGAVKYAPTLAVKTPYNAEGDCELFELETMPFFAEDVDSPNKVVVNAGELAIFAPDDLHASMIYVDQPEHVRKVIVKCRV